MNENIEIIQNEQNNSRPINLKINTTDLHKIISHNCTGFNKNHHSFFESDVSFILLQETWHMPSTKIIDDPTMNFSKFAVSAMDEEQDRVTSKGGLMYI